MKRELGLEIAKMTNFIGFAIEGRTIKKILSQATILHNGWELDNAAWAVEFTDGTKAIIATLHGGFYIAKNKEFEEKLQETQKSVDEIVKILEDVKT